MKIDVLGELKTYGEVRSTNCTVCLKCTDECSKDAVSYTFRHPNTSMSPEAAVRAERQTSKRRKLSAFDVVIALLWMSVVLAFSVAGLRQNAPQAIKVLMTPGLLLVFYGLALLAREAWRKYGRVKQRA
jgi:hypothetical protein